MASPVFIAHKVHDHRAWHAHDGLDPKRSDSGAAGSRMKDAGIPGLVFDAAADYGDA